MILRPVTLQDGPALRALLDEPSVERWWPEHEPGRHGRTVMGEGYVLALVIEVDGEVAGWIGAGEEDEPDYKEADMDLFLGSRWQGRGIGVRAIEEVVQRMARERGHHRFTLYTAAANERAHRAYAKAGFRNVGVLERAERGLDGTWSDLILFERVLPA